MFLVKVLLLIFLLFTIAGAEDSSAGEFPVLWGSVAGGPGSMGACWGGTIHYQPSLFYSTLFFDMTADNIYTIGPSVGVALRRRWFNMGVTSGPSFTWGGYSDIPENETQARNYKSVSALGARIWGHMMFTSAEYLGLGIEWGVNFNRDINYTSLRTAVHFGNFGEPRSSSWDLETAQRKKRRGLIYRNIGIGISAASVLPLITGIVIQNIDMEGWEEEISRFAYIVTGVTAATGTTFIITGVTMREKAERRLKSLSLVPAYNGVFVAGEF